MEPQGFTNNLIISLELLSAEQPNSRALIVSQSTYYVAYSTIDLLISTFQLLSHLHAASAEVNLYVSKENRLEVCFSLVKSYDPKKKSILLLF